MERYCYRINQITVCLVVDGKQAARGIAICSPLDTFDISVGGKIAFQNAMKAMGNSKHLRPIVDWRARKTLLESDCPFVRKGEKNPVLTWREVKMVKGVKDPFVFSCKDKLQRAAQNFLDFHIRNSFNEMLTCKEISW